MNLINKAGRLVSVAPERVEGLLEQGFTREAEGLPEGFPARELLGEYESVEAVQAASDDELMEIKGLGAGTLRQIREWTPRK